MSIARLDQDQAEKTIKRPARKPAKPRTRSTKAKTLGVLRKTTKAPYKAAKRIPRVTKSAAHSIGSTTLKAITPARPLLATIGAYLTLVSLALALLISLGIAGVLIIGIALLLLSAVPTIAGHPHPLTIPV